MEHYFSRKTQRGLKQVKSTKAEIHPILKSYIPVAEGIAKTFGNFCEVVLHDVTDVSDSIVAIFNGHVTARQTGSPMTDLGLKTIKKGLEGNDLLTNYKSRAENGKEIKSSSMMIRDEGGELLGCLCINLDTSYLSVTHSFVQDLLKTEEEQAEQKESFSLSITDLEKKIIQEGTKKVGVPIQLMDKDQKVAFIQYLDDMGLFLIKGSVQNAARILNVSKFTIYNYLEKKD